MIEAHTPPDAVETAARIADALGETDPVARGSIQQIVRLRGAGWADRLLRRTRVIEGDGGLLTFDRSRRRTPGGVFLFLARNRLDEAELPQVFPGWRPPPAASRPQRLAWDDRLEPVREALRHKGEVKSVKLTLIGRPGRVLERNNVFVLTMEQTRAPSLPKGLPVPPSVATTYTVFIAGKQWRKVAGVVDDPEDQLIIEGLPMQDPRTGTISVFTSSVTTKKAQIARKAAGAAGAPPHNAE